MDPAVIDLGELPRDPAADAGPAGRPPVPYRLVLGLLSVVLAWLLGGAVHPAEPAEPVVIDSRQGENTFPVDGRLFVVSAGPERFGPSIQDKYVTEYALPDGRSLSRTTVAVTGAIFDVVAAGGSLLVSAQADEYGEEATVAMVRGTDRARWRIAGQLDGLSEPAGLVLMQRRDPLDESLDWTGVDLVTGRPRWVVHQPAGGFSAGAAKDSGGFATRLVVGTGSGRLRTYDTRTGTVVDDVAAPPGTVVWTVGDLVLVGDDRRGTLTAYTLTGLAERWRTGLDLTGRYISPACGDVLCVLDSNRGMRVLDLATGRQLWRSDRWSYAQRGTTYLLAGEFAGDPHYYLLDPRTGEVRGDFGGWQRIESVEPDGSVIGVQREPGLPPGVWFARLETDRPGVRVLGRAARATESCQSTRVALICRRIDASIGVWSLT